MPDYEVFMRETVSRRYWVTADSEDDALEQVNNNTGEVDFREVDHLGSELESIEEIED